MSNGAWTQRGGNIDGVESNDLMGESLDMSEDGNHLIIGAHGGTNLNASFMIIIPVPTLGTNWWQYIGRYFRFQFRYIFSNIE